ncbi:unnamed protein product [Closterium sp. Yama58-4]|nr:unnamed protein product [Closterium sp. Yama58-4]
MLPPSRSPSHWRTNRFAPTLEEAAVEARAQREWRWWRRSATAHELPSLRPSPTLHLPLLPPFPSCSASCPAFSHPSPRFRQAQAARLHPPFPLPSLLLPSPLPPSLYPPHGRRPTGCASAFCASALPLPLALKSISAGSRRGGGRDARAAGVELVERTVAVVQAECDRRYSHSSLFHELGLLALIVYSHCRYFVVYCRSVCLCFIVYCRSVCRYFVLYCRSVCRFFMANWAFSFFIAYCRCFVAVRRCLVALAVAFTRRFSSHYLTRLL